MDDVAISDIREAVCAHFGLTLPQLIGQQRARRYARPRQIAMYLSSRLTAHSLPAIGRHIGNRDHTTIIHGIRFIEGQIARRDVAILAAIEDIGRKLAQGKAMKIRHVNLHADEFLAAIAGELTAAELGVYWMICLLIYSRGGPIPDDEKWLRRKFAPTAALRSLHTIVDRLVESGRICRDHAELSVSRCLDELEHASSRVRASSENGLRGGRPPNNINEIDKPKPFDARKLTTNHKPITNNQYAREGFARWWDRYPHKVGKAAAEKAFRTALAKASEDTLMAGLDRYIAAKPPDRQWCNPETWLNQDRWLDAPAANGAVLIADSKAMEASWARHEAFWRNFPDPKALDRNFDWAARLRGWVESPRGYWPQQFGPRPNEPGCQAPKPMVEWAIAKLEPPPAL